jgi:hypothetical protein
MASQCVGAPQSFGYAVRAGHRGDQGGGLVEG